MTPHLNSLDPLFLFDTEKYFTDNREGELSEVQFQSEGGASEPVQPVHLRPTK